MSLDWASLEPKAEQAPDLDGPLVVLGARGVRINAKTSKEPGRRISNLHERMYQLVAYLLAGKHEDVATHPRQGFVKVHGTGTPLYVRGCNEVDLLTTIGKAMLAASVDDRVFFDGLGFSAIEEW